MHLEKPYIVKSGYLVKSPPLQGAKKLIPKRWMLRWFVLYDTRGQIADAGKGEFDVKLFYFKDQSTFVNGEPPYGQINLRNAVVTPLRKSVHGYPHVIDVNSSNRRYYLCTTSEMVFNGWLDKLQQAVGTGSRRNSLTVPPLPQKKKRSQSLVPTESLENDFSSVLARPHTEYEREDSWQSYRDFIMYGRTQFLRGTLSRIDSFQATSPKSETMPTATSSQHNKNGDDIDDVFPDSFVPADRKNPLAFTVSKIPCLPDSDDESEMVNVYTEVYRDSGFLSGDEDDDEMPLEKMLPASPKVRVRSDSEVSKEKQHPDTVLRSLSLSAPRSQAEETSQSQANVACNSDTDGNSHSYNRSVSLFVDNEYDDEPLFTGPRLKPSSKTKWQSTGSLLSRADTFLQALPPGPARDSFIEQFQRASLVNPTIYEIKY